MNTSIKPRIAALFASILVTFASVYVIAAYAYPEAPAVKLASASRGAGCTAKSDPGDLRDTHTLLRRKSCAN
jgi:hypothetical protein